MAAKLIAQRFSNAQFNYHEHANVQKKVANSLIKRLLQVSTIKNYPKILEIGCGTGFLTNNINKHLNFNHLYLNDLYRSDLIKLNSKMSFLIGNAEEIVLPSNLDLIISSSTLQWFNDIDLFFTKAHQNLNSNGIIAFSAFDIDNFNELNEFLVNKPHYMNANEINIRLNGKFDLLYIHSEKIILNFNKALDLLRHIKLTGVNALSSKVMSVKQLKALISTLNTRNLTLTYHPIYVIAKKKDKTCKRDYILYQE